MAHQLQLLFEADADAEIRALWRQLEDSGVPSLASLSHRRHRPHVTLAVAGAIPAATRARLSSELERLSIPDLWLYTLGTFPSDGVLMLGAVVDTEILAVHSAVHDILAGKVTNASAAYLPGAWIPHCALAKGVTPAQVAAGFAALQPPRPVRATVAHVAVADTRTGELETLF